MAPKAVMMLSPSAEEHGSARPKPAVDTIEVPPHSSCPEHLVRIGNALTPPIKDAIISLLQ